MTVKSSSKVSQFELFADRAQDTFNEVGPIVTEAVKAGFVYWDGIELSHTRSYRGASFNAGIHRELKELMANNSSWKEHSFPSYSFWHNASKNASLVLCRGDDTVARDPDCSRTKRRVSKYIREMVLAQPYTEDLFAPTISEVAHSTISPVVFVLLYDIQLLEDGSGQPYAELVVPSAIELDGRIARSFMRSPLDLTSEGEYLNHENLYNDDPEFDIQRKASSGDDG